MCSQDKETEKAESDEEEVERIWYQQWQRQEEDEAAPMMRIEGQSGRWRWFTLARGKGLGT